MEVSYQLHAPATLPHIIHDHHFFDIYESCTHHPRFQRYADLFICLICTLRNPFMAVLRGKLNFIVFMNSEAFHCHTAEQKLY